MKTRFISAFALGVIFASASFAAPDIRITPLSMTVSRSSKPQIYLEIDWMEDNGHSHKPSQAVIDRVVAAFAREGFDIHIDVSNQIPAQNPIPIINSNVSGSPAVQAIRDANFNHINDSRYYYSIWCHNYTNNGVATSSSGIADLPGRITLVSLGSFDGMTGTADQQVGTMIHEFGHNLGQLHGGTDSVNFKPNYVSVMNYHYQLSGIGPVLFAKGWANSAAGWNDFGYSHGTLPDLDEGHLDETVGIGLGKAIDWNKSGSATDTNVAVNIRDSLLNAGFSNGLPSGWIVGTATGASTTAKWRFDDPGARGNLTGGTGGFAIADSDNAGAIDMGTFMTTGTINCTDRFDVALEFRTDFRRFESEFCDVEVSVDGGASFANIWRRNGADERGPKDFTIAVPQANDKANVKFRFFYFNANNEWWWQVDDISVPGRSATALTDFDNWGDIVGQVRNRVLMPNLEIPKQPAERCITAEVAEKQKAELDALLKERGPDRGLAESERAAMQPILNAPQPTDGFTIFNDGNQDLVISSITPQTSAPWLSISPTLPMTIKPGDSRTVAVGVNFTTAPLNSTTTRLLVASNDPDENPYPGGVNVTVVQEANLTPYQDPSWSDKIVVSKVTGTNTDSSQLLSTDTLYVDWVVVNDGRADILSNFSIPLTVDGVTKFTYNAPPPTPAGTTRLILDANIGSLTAGVHTIGITADSTSVVAELDETDNAYTKSIFVNAANDNFANAQTLTGSSGTVISHNGNMTKESGEPNIAGNAGGHSIWFNWTAPITGPATVDTFNSGFDTLLGVYTGNAVNALTLVAANDDAVSGSNNRSRVQFTAVAGTVYRIVVDGFNSGVGAATGPITLNYQVTGLTSTSDSGFGSLRQIIADIPAGATTSIALDPSLSGQTITLTSGQLVLNRDITIDASALPAGLTINGNAARIFNVASGNSVTLKNLTLTNGGANGASFPDDSGGAIHNTGTLLLQNCTFTGNSAGKGGAINNYTSFDFVSSSTTAQYCTFAGNTATSAGGAIYNLNGRTTLTNCTISANSAPIGSGAASYGDNQTQTRAQNTIIAGNSSSDIDITPGSTNSFSSLCHNIVGNGGAIGNFNQVGDLVSTAPLLAPLDNYGGPTKTMALILASPARNAAAVLSPAQTADQRYFPIIGAPDIGAYEAGTLTNYNAYIWETLPAAVTVAQHFTTADYDGDGMNNFNEWLADTNAANATSVFRPTNSARSGSNFSITFATSANRNYSVEYSFDLVSWTTFTSVPGTGNPMTVFLGPVTGFPKFFARARAGF